MKNTSTMAGWSILHEAKMIKKALRAQKNLNMLDLKHVKYHTLEGHIYVGDVDFWPCSSWWRNRVTKKVGKGVESFLREIYG